MSMSVYDRLWRADKVTKFFLISGSIFVAVLVAVAFLWWGAQGRADARGVALQELRQEVAALSVELESVSGERDDAKVKVVGLEDELRLLESELERVSELLVLERDGEVLVRVSRRVVAEVLEVGAEAMLQVQSCFEAVELLLAAQGVLGEGFLGEDEVVELDEVFVEQVSLVCGDAAQSHESLHGLLQELSVENALN